MRANSVVRARIDENVKAEASAVLATMGLTVSDAFRLMMMRIANDKALPFEPLVLLEPLVPVLAFVLAVCACIGALISGLYPCTFIVAFLS